MEASRRFCVAYDMILIVCPKDWTGTTFLLEQRHAASRADPRELVKHIH